MYSKVFILDNSIGKTVIFVCLVTFNWTWNWYIGLKLYTTTQAADVDSLSDLGLFNLPRAAGQTLLSMAGFGHQHAMENNLENP